tara:strand:- start:6884 stop:14275 length:7392 start_codon:yes stop_codon:yes gene_type:complete
MAEQDKQQTFDEFASLSNFIDPASTSGTPRPTAPFLGPIDTSPGVFSNPTNFIQSNTGGVPPNYTPSQVKQNYSNPNSGGDWLKALVQQTDAQVATMQDKNQYAKMYAFDSSPNGAFKARYKGFGQETYNKLGFDPMIDNETYYTQNTTTGDDLTRIMKHTALPMLGLGFMSPIHSYGSIMSGQGLFSASESEAKDYEYYSQIGYSSRGGLGGFTANLVNSAAYSAGILLEGAVEGAVIGAVVGFAEGGVGAIPGAAVGGATGFFKNLWKLPSAIYKSAKTFGKTLANLKNYAKLGEAKSLFEAAGKTIGNFGKDLGSTLNPISNTTASLAENVLSNANNLSNLARSARTAGALWHDVKNMNLGISEGRLEGGFTQNQVFGQLYNDYYNVYKEAPSDALQEQFMAQAKEAGTMNTMLNSALVFYSNKIAFPSITKASFIKGLPKLGFGKVVASAGKEFQIVYNPAAKAAEAAYTKEAVSMGNALKGLVKPKIYGRVALNYFKANLVEGFQEVSQDVLSETTKNYYVDGFNNPATKNFRYGMGLLGHATKNQFSAQGFNTFASGLLMGTVLQGPGKLKSFLSMGYNRYYKNRANWDEYIKEREGAADELLAALNTMHSNGNFFFDPRINNYSTQVLVGKMVDEPDTLTKKEAKDAEFTAFTSAVITSLRTNTFSMFLDNFKGYTEASPKDLEDAWNLEPGQGQKALENITQAITSAKRMEGRYREVKSKMKYMANLDEFKEGTPEYTKAKIYNDAYGAALSNLVFLEAAFDKNMERSNKLFQRLSSISSIRNNEFGDAAILTDTERLSREIAMRTTELKTLKQSLENSANPVVLSSDIERKESLLNLLTNFQEKQGNVLNAWFGNKILEQAKAEMMKNDPSLTDKDAEVAVFNEMLKDFENGKAPEFLEYKESFENLLKGLVKNDSGMRDLEKDFKDMDGMDGLFTDLLDTHIIKNETASLSKYVNMLVNPRDFYEHVDRNYQWMQELYANRQDYFKDIVNQEISNIEKNAILNELAHQGIYVDLEQFADWVKDHNKLPEYFINITDETIINKDSLLYKEYIDIFEKAAEADAIPPAGKPSSDKEKLNESIKELESKRLAELEKAKEAYNNDLKEAHGFTEKEFAEQSAKVEEDNALNDEEKQKLNAEKSYLEKALAQLQSSNIVEVQAIYDTAVEQGYLTDELFAQTTEVMVTVPEAMVKVREAVKKYDENESREARSSAAFQSVILTQLFTDRAEEVNAELARPDAVSSFKLEDTDQYKIYQDKVKSIDERYDAYIAEVKAKFKEKGVDENTPIIVTTTTPFENFPQELKNDITELFDDYLVNILEEDSALENTNPNEYARLRSRWLETQPELIDSFNQKMAEETKLKAERLAAPPQLTFIPYKATAETTGYELTKIYERLKGYLEAGEYPDPNNKNKNKQLSPADIQAINSDLAAIQGYIEARATAYEAKSVAEETINRITQTIIDRRNEVVDVYDENGNKIGRRFADNPETAPAPLRVTQVAEEIQDDIAGKEPFLYGPLQNAEDGGPSAVENLYNRFFNNEDVPAEDAVELFLEAFKKQAYTSWKVFQSKSKLDRLEESIRNNTSFQNVFDTVKRLAYVESTDAGDVIDTMIRTFLTPAVGKSGFVEVGYDSTINTGRKTVKVSEVMSKQAYDSLFHPVTGIVTKFRQGVIDGEWVILSENVTLFDKRLRDNGITGEIDLLAIDKNGNVKIIDIKTGKLKNWLAFGTGKKNDKQLYFRAQQSIYADLFYNHTGIEVSEIGLLPLAIDVTLDGYINSVQVAPIVPEGSETVKLEYLPEVANYGITKIKPELPAVESVKRETGKGAANLKPSTQESDPSKITLGEFLNKPLMFNGRVGILIQLPDGTYGIEYTKTTDTGLLELSLEGFKNDLAFEQSPDGDPELAKQIQVEIAKIETSLAETGQLKEVVPVKYNFTTANDPKLSLQMVGLKPIFLTEEVGQVSTVNQKVINARFDNTDQTIATINDVKYTVYRNSQGNITALSYISNEKAVNAIEKETGRLSNKIGRLRQKVRDLTGKDLNFKDLLNAQIRDLEVKIERLNIQRTDLLKTNKKIFVTGQNSDNLIFALNRLPNSFQKLTKNKTAADEKKDLKAIHQLSLSSAVSSTITEILSENYPDVLDRLIDNGIEGLKKGDITTINNWITETIEKLEELGYSVINRGDIVDDVVNQINGLMDLQNDLELINYTKNGRISKKQEYADQVFGPNKAEVPVRTDVPKNEKPAGGQAAGVPGPTSTEELKALVKKAKGQDSDLLDNLNEDVFESDQVTKIKQATLDTIDAVYEQALLEASVENSGISLDEIEAAYTARLNELKTIVSVKNLTPGKEYLISKNPIFTEFSDEIVLVEKVKGNTVTLKNINTNESRDFTEEELIQNFEKTTMEAREVKPEVTITPEDTENSEKSAANLKDLANEEETLSTAKQNAAASTFNALLQKVKDNSNLC